MDEIREQLDQALSVARGEDYPRALEMCDSLIKENPSSSDPFRTRSQIYFRMGDFSRAITDITEAMRRSNSEPKDYFFRGWWNLESGNLSAAIHDLTTAIRLGDELDFHYFDESALFFRSVAYLRSARYQEALADCERVSDDFLIYLRSGQVSKKGIVLEATSSIRGAD